MELLKRLYEKLHLSVNESKSAVTSAFGHKFLGYELWMVRGEVKRAASYKAQKQFKQRIRWHTLKKELMLRSPSDLSLAGAMVREAVDIAGRNYRICF
jgi:hypothetical protein